MGGFVHFHGTELETVECSPPVACAFLAEKNRTTRIELVKLDSRGPVFFRQKRTGYRGRTFNCFKLRTMKVNKSAHDMQASLNDPRITRMGRFLRMSNLDELPQFINVL